MNIKTIKINESMFRKTSKKYSQEVIRLRDGQVHFCDKVQDMEPTFQQNHKTSETKKLVNTVFSDEQAQTSRQVNRLIGKYAVKKTMKLLEASVNFFQIIRAKEGSSQNEKSYQLVHRNRIMSPNNQLIADLVRRQNQMGFNGQQIELKVRAIEPF